MIKDMKNFGNSLITTKKILKDEIILEINSSFFLNCNCIVKN